MRHSMTSACGSANQSLGSSNRRPPSSDHAAPLVR
ncbi:Uncharacterised protein [Bordetella pertussis]|nr:Uncharacterised protein [Bordetella pertussis]